MHLEFVFIFLVVVRVQNAFSASRFRKTRLATPTTIYPLDVTRSTTEGPFEVTPEMLLREAARIGNLTRVIELLSEGLPVDDTDARGWTGLMWASREGHEDIVDYFLEQGANEDHVSNTGDSSLLWASYGGFMSIVRTFLTINVDPNIAEQNGLTPLMAAAVGGHLDIIQLLLDEGANKTMVDNNGLNALTLATRTGKTEVILLLNDFVIVNSQDYLGWTPLHHAISLNTSLGAEELGYHLTFCPNLDIIATIGTNNWTAFDFAVGMNNEDALDIFQEHFSKLSGACILDEEEYGFSESVYFDCREVQCHCYGHWEPIGYDPGCRKISLEVLASQNFKNKGMFLTSPEV